MTTIRDPNGGRNADPSNSKESSYFGILQSLAKLILEKGEEGINALQEAMGFDEGSEAMREFNEKMDEMPTASQPISMRPDRRDMEPMRKMTPRGVDPNQFLPQKTSRFFDPLQQSKTNVGQGAEQRRRRFRR